MVPGASPGELLQQAGEVTPGRNKCRGSPDKCCISPGRGSSTPPTRPASTIASVLEEGNLQAGGTNGKEPSSPPPDGFCHGKIPLPAPLQGLCWEHLWGARQVPAQQALNSRALHPGSDITVPRDLGQLPEPSVSPEGTDTTSPPTLSCHTGADRFPRRNLVQVTNAAALNHPPGTWKS